MGILFFFFLISYKIRVRENQGAVLIRRREIKTLFLTILGVDNIVYCL